MTNLEKAIMLRAVPILLLVAAAFGTITVVTHNATWLGAAISFLSLAVLFDYIRRNGKEGK